MAPSPRRSSRASPRKMDFRQAGHSRENSWEVLRNTQGEDIDMLDESAEHSSLPDHANEDPLDPLRAMADRVGHEVENFAIQVDAFIHLNKDPEVDKFDSALNLVSGLKSIADSTVELLEDRHGEERPDDSPQSARRKIRGSTPQLTSTAKDGKADAGEDNLTTVEDLWRWQEEADTWSLLERMLKARQLGYDDDEDSVRKARQEKLLEFGKPTKQATDADIWFRFLLDSEGAYEKEIVVQWLQNTVTSTTDEGLDLVDELDEATGQSADSWSQGWLLTREKIKAQKRIRAWETPLGASLPSIRSSDGTENLITQLDPDAPTRQRRGLEKKDRSYERAVWVTIWEWLRRGWQWSAIRDWCSDKNESWRAVSLGFASSPEGNGRTWVGGVTKGALWRMVCYAASQQEGEDEYQRACYGMLGGNVKAVEPVCRSLDDILFAHHHAALIRQFDRYLRTSFPDDLPDKLWTKLGVKLPGREKDDQEDVTPQTLKRLAQKSWKLSPESLTPMKAIQLALLCKEHRQLLHDVGCYVSERETDKGETLATKHRMASLICDDRNALRVAAHMTIVFQALDRRLQPSKAVRTAAENVIVAHIDNLEESGKMEAIPTYVAVLSEPRQWTALAAVLPAITELDDQKMMLRLMEEYELNISQTLYHHYAFTIRESSLLQRGQPSGNKKDPSKGPIPHPGQDLPWIDSVDLLDRTEFGVWPGLCLDSEFMSREMEPDEEAIIRSLEWFKQVPGMWFETFDGMYNALVKFLLTGRLTAALSLCIKLPYINVSMMKTQAIVGRAVDIFDEDEEFDEDHTFQVPVQGGSGSSGSNGGVNGAASSNGDSSYHGGRTEAIAVRDMRRSSEPLLQLQQLVAAIDLMRECRTLLEPQNLRDSRNAHLPKELFGELTERMEPILWDFLLQEDLDLYMVKTHGLKAAEQQLADFRRLRALYLPECILAYLAILHRAAFLLHSPDYLITAMELAPILAREDTGFPATLTAAGRAGEVVEMFGHCAKALLILAPKKPESRPERKRDWQGHTPYIWDVTGQYLV